MNIYEQHGRLVEQYEMECEAHRRTVDVLRRLKQGEIDIASLTVTDDNQWAISSIEPVEDTTPVN